MSDGIYQDLGTGITCIDTGFIRPGMAACYLMQHNGEAAVIETGTSHAITRILELLVRKGLSREQVRYVIPTHVHLDHAGGAGALMEELPKAILVLHPRGVRHMINPEKLITGARAVYGDELFNRLFGKIVPVPAQRIIEADDGFSVDLGGRPLLMRDTQGHANHHFCVWDAMSKGWFTGDTFGISYRENEFPAGRYVFPTSSPVQFDPQKLLESIQLLLSSRPECMYLTHFGRLGNVQVVAESLSRQIRDYRDMAQELMTVENRVMRLRERLTDYTLTEMAKLNPQINAEGILEIIEMDMDLNAQGLDVWLSRRK